MQLFSHRHGPREIQRPRRRRRRGQADRAAAAAVLSRNFGYEGPAAGSTIHHEVKRPELAHPVSRLVYFIFHATYSPARATDGLCFSPTRLLDACIFILLCRWKYIFFYQYSAAAAAAAPLFFSLHFSSATMELLGSMCALFFLGNIYVNVSLVLHFIEF